MVDVVESMKQLLIIFEGAKTKWLKMPHTRYFFALFAQSVQDTETGIHLTGFKSILVTEGKSTPKIAAVDLKQTSH